MLYCHFAGLHRKPLSRCLLFLALIGIFCVNARSFGNATSSTSETTAANIALHRAAYQSGSADDDHTAHLATDGSPATYWESEPNSDAWIDIDLHSSCSVDHITLKWGDTYAVAYRIQISSDGLQPKMWKDVYATTNGVGGIEHIAIGATAARHVLLIVSAYSAKNRGCKLSEFEVN